MEHSETIKLLAFIVFLYIFGSFGNNRVKNKEFEVK